MRRNMRPKSGYYEILYELIAQQSKNWLQRFPATAAVGETGRFWALRKQKAEGSRIVWVENK